MIEDKVSTHHPRYDELQPMRKAFHAVKGGTRTMRAEGKSLLPKYPAESNDDYKGRLACSTIDGLVQGGVETLTGTFFEGEIDTSKVNPSIVPLLENVDNCGNNLNVFVRDAVEASFDGCSVMWVDMPIATDETRQLEQERGAEADAILNKRPFATLFEANEIIKWRYEIHPVTKKEELTLLVRQFCVEMPEGDYGTKDVIHYQAWFLNNGVVSWKLYEEKGTPPSATSTTQSNPILVDEGTMVGISRIPAAIMGELTDEPKLMVETDLEIKAYQKESSYDTIEYMSVPTLLFIGRTNTEGSTAIGASAVFDVPVEGDAKWLQIDAAGHESLKSTIKGVKAEIKGRVNMMVSSAMESGPDKTATQVATEDKDKQARLLVWSEQAKDATEQMLSYFAEFMGLGIDAGGEVVFNTKWMVAAQRAQEQKDFDSQIITDEQERKRIETEAKVRAMKG